MRRIGRPDYKNGTKNIWLLGLASLLNDAGSEIINLVLPFFITALGGGGIALGALSGLREGLSSIFKLLGGWYSDRIAKRMPIVFSGYLVSAICKFFIAISAAWYYVIAFVSLERLGKVRDAPRDALIADSTDKRGKGYGLHQALDTAGAIIGSLIALFLFWKFNIGFKPIIIIAAIIASLSLLPLFFVKEPKNKPDKTNLFKGIHLLDRKLKYFIFVSAIFALGNFGMYMFLLLRARQITGSIVTAIALGVIFNLVWALLSTPLGTQSDKLGRKRIILCGYALFAIVALGFVFASSIASLILLFALFGLVYALVQGNQRAFVADLSGRMKGTAMGFFQFVTGIVTIAGGIIAGFFWNISPQTMFKYIFAVSLLSVILLFFVKEK